MFKWAWVGAVLLAAFALPAESAISVKPGSSCSKQGLAKINKGKKYTCIKAGKLLVWNKGVLIKKPTLTPTSPATPTPSPSFTPIPKRVSKAGEPFLASEYPLIGKIATENFLGQNAPPKDVIDVAWDPTTTEAKRKWLGAQIEAMKKLFTPLVPSGVSLKIIVMGADVEWSREQIRELSNDNPDIWRDYNDRFYLASKCALDEYGVVTTDNKWPGPYTTYRGGGGGSIPGKAFAYVTMANCDAYIEKDILFHEAFHSVQFLNSYITAKYFGNQSYGWGLVPPWIREGQAQYVGMRMSSNFEGASVVFDNGGALWANARETIRWKSEYNYLTTYENSDAYWIGAIMNEYLIAKFGIEKVMTIYDATVKRDKLGNFDTATRFAPFDEAFAEVFGQSRDSFVEEARPYIQWSLDLEKNK